MHPSLSNSPSVRIFSLVFNFSVVEINNYQQQPLNSQPPSMKSENLVSSSFSNQVCISYCVDIYNLSDLKIAGKAV